MATTLQLTAQIVRQLAEKIAGIPARKITLCETIEPTFIPEHNAGHSWWNGASTNRDTLYGFNPDTGFVKLDIKPNYSYSDNGTPYTDKGESISEYLERTNTNYQFYLLHSEGKGYGENGEYYDNWYLYKGFNLNEYLSSLNEQDIKRWEEWLIS